MSVNDKRGVCDKIETNNVYSDPLVICLQIGHLFYPRRCMGETRTRVDHVYIYIYLYLYPSCLTYLWYRILYLFYFIFCRISLIFFHYMYTTHKSFGFYDPTGGGLYSRWRKGYPPTCIYIHTQRII